MFRQRFIGKIRVIVANTLSKQEPFKAIQLFFLLLKSMDYVCDGSLIGEGWPRIVANSLPIYFLKISVPQALITQPCISFPKINIY